MDFFGTDGLDGHKVAAGGNAQVEGAVQLLPQLAMTHDRLDALNTSRAADVGGGDAGSALQAILLVSLLQMAFQQSSDFSAPLRSFGHLRQLFEFQNDAGDLHGDGAFQDVGGHFLVMGQHFRPGGLGDVHYGESEVDFRKYRSISDGEIEAAVHRLGRKTKQEILRARDGQGFEDF